MRFTAALWFLTVSAQDAQYILASRACGYVPPIAVSRPAGRRRSTSGRAATAQPSPYAAGPWLSGAPASRSWPPPWLRQPPAGPRPRWPCFRSCGHARPAAGQPRAFRWRHWPPPRPPRPPGPPQRPTGPAATPPSWRPGRPIRTRRAGSPDGAPSAVPPQPRRRPAPGPRTCSSCQSPVTAYAVPVSAMGCSALVIIRMMPREASRCSWCRGGRRFRRGPDTGKRAEVSERTAAAASGWRVTLRARLPRPGGQDLLADPGPAAAVWCMIISSGSQTSAVRAPTSAGCSRTRMPCRAQAADHEQAHGLVEGELRRVFQSPSSPVPVLGRSSRIPGR